MTVSMLVTGSAATLLALADQRLPSGGHTHSGGIEQAVTEGLVSDAASLAVFLRRRLWGVGVVSAGVAAAAVSVSDAADLELLDAELDARTPSPAQREASRSQGRGLLRLARACWAAPSPGLSWSVLGARPHHPVVLGCAGRSAGLDPPQIALVAAYLAMTGPATAAQRLLGLDPVEVAAVTVHLGDDVAQVAEQAAAVAATGPPFDGLPDTGDPWIDLLAERHAPRGDRLFAS